MAKYEHKKRKGFILYHSDYRIMIKPLSPDQQCKVIDNLVSISESIAEGKKIPDISMPYPESIAFETIKEKIIRESEAYENTCKARAEARAKLTKVDNSQQSSLNVNVNGNVNVKENVNGKRSISAQKYHQRDYQDDTSDMDEMMNNR